MLSAPLDTFIQNQIQNLLWNKWNSAWSFPVKNLIEIRAKRNEPERREGSKGKRIVAKEWSAQMTWSTCFAFFIAEITSATLLTTSPSNSLFPKPSSIGATLLPSATSLHTASGTSEMTRLCLKLWGRMNGVV